MAMRRRQFLSTLGASAAMLPVISSLRGLSAAAAAGPPKRLITFFVSSGCARSFFWPDNGGTNFDLKTSLAPLAPYKSRMTIVQGLGLGPGTDHRYGMDNCLTVGGKISYENAIADALKTPVLNLCVAPLYSGEDMSVRAGAKLHGISDPLLAREEILRGFVPGGTTSTPNPNIAAVRKFKSLALGLSQSELDQLKSRVTGLAYESGKLQSHIEAVQALKLELAKDPVTMGGNTMSCSTLATTALDLTKGLASSGEACKANLPALLDAQIENVVESFKCGGRTIANLQVMHAWGNIGFTWIGLSQAHHQELSHWIPSDPTGGTAAKFAQCHNWLSSRFLTLLQKLDVPDPLDPGKTILDNTAILWTSEVNGSDSHIVDSIPAVVFGNLGGALKQGQALSYTKRNMGDLFATLATAMGVPMTSFGTNGSKETIKEMLA
jgi:hypothetical protein